MQKDKQFRAIDNWALASDGLQWVLQRRKGKHWEAVSFVRSSKDVLSRCMREKGTPPDVADQLLDGLPACFEAWHEQFWPPGLSITAQLTKIVMTPLGRPNKRAPSETLAA
jgi:hypothetical protein